MTRPKVAIVTPVYNGEETIEKSIQTILSQIYNNWICVIINDGSTDGTKTILEKYENDERFLIVNLENNVGRGEARKQALKIVQNINADYMCMLDADDLYYNDKIDWQVEYMQTNPDIALLSCSIGYIDSENNLLGVLETFNEVKVLSFDNYLNYIPVPHACSIIRVNQIDDVTFDEKLKLGQDQDFMIRMLLNKKYAFVPKIGYLYNRTDSFSFSKYKKSLDYSLYAKKKLNLSQSYFLKLKAINTLKIAVVGILSLINKQDLYLDKIGRKANNTELEEHKSSKL